MKCEVVVGTPATEQRGVAASDLIDLVILAPPGTGKTWVQNELDGQRFEAWKINVLDTDQCSNWGTPKPYKCKSKSPKSEEEAIAILNFCFRKHVDPGEVNILFTNVRTFYNALAGTRSSFIARAPMTTVDSVTWLEERGYSDEELERYRVWQRQAAENPDAFPVPHEKLGAVIRYILTYDVKSNVVELQRNKEGHVAVAVRTRRKE